MPDINPLIERNEHFVTTGAYKGAPMYPRREVCVVTCLDPRTDPANFLELEAGDAVVKRNAGGRVNQALGMISPSSPTSPRPAAGQR